MRAETPMQALSRKEIEAMIAWMKGNAMPSIRNRKRSVETERMPKPDVPEMHEPGYIPMPLKMDFGIKREKGSMRDLTAEECHELFGLEMSIKMNFIPQMLQSLVMDQATQLVNYCRDNKVGEIKKHTRVIRTAVEEYAQMLRYAYGDAAFRSYVTYSERFLAETALNVRLMEMHADTLCKNQAPNGRHYPIFVRVLVIVMLCKFCDKFDAEMDKVISSKMGKAVRAHRDAYRDALHIVCLSIAEDLGYKVNPDKVMGDWVLVLRNKAHFLADKIMEEEQVTQGRL